MVLNFEQEKELEVLKHTQKKELLDLNRQAEKEEHDRKMQRLDKMLEIAKAGKTMKEAHRLSKEEYGNA